MTKQNIRISVCLASYNGERFIAEQINSILPQLGLNDELIISDDNSTDSTVVIIRQIQQLDKRIILLTDNHYQNPVYNFENALNNSHGEFIFLADQDDIWLPGKVEQITTKLKDYLLVVHDAEVVNESLQPLAASYLQFRNGGTGFWHNLYKNSYTGCCMAFRRSLLKTALPFPKRLLFHDQWLGLLANLSGHVLFLHQPFILFRRHDKNASFGINTSQNTMIRKTVNRLILLKQLITRIILKK